MNKIQRTGLIGSLFLSLFVLSSCITIPNLKKECTFNPPQAPNPLPVGFDWNPLAENWCKQLEDCGMGFNNCVNEYMSAINNPPPAGVTLVDSTDNTPTTIGVEKTQTDEGSMDLVCENSEEYLNRTFSCYQGELEEIPLLVEQ